MQSVSYPKNALPLTYQSFKALHFAGIKPAYSTATHTIHPLKLDIHQNQIDALQKHISQQKKPDGEGMNGRAFIVPSPFNEIPGDVVVKIHKGKDAKFTPHHGQKEVHALDLLDDLWQAHGLKGSQLGLVAFKPKDGLQHIVSTRVLGRNPDVRNNPITKEALKSCIEQLILFDKGTPEEGRFFHSDINPKNINVTATGAGFYDWEHLFTEPLELMILRGASRKTGYEKYHFYKHDGPILHDTADTFPFKSNLKHFEARVIYPYLREFSQSGLKLEGRQFFQSYLHQKASYHKAMQAHYTAVAQSVKQDKSVPENAREHYSRALNKVARSEAIHADLLIGKDAKTPRDIVKSELYKMRLAYFAWLSRGVHQDKFNGAQVGEFFDQSKQYFEERFNLAKQEKDVKRQRYYKNCLMIIQALDTHLNSSRPVFNPSDTERVEPQFYCKPARIRMSSEPRHSDLEETLFMS
jgi:hypothetical protein